MIWWELARVSTSQFATSYHIVSYRTKVPSSYKVPKVPWYDSATVMYEGTSTYWHRVYQMIRLDMSCVVLRHGPWPKMQTTIPGTCFGVGNRSTCVSNFCLYFAIKTCAKSGTEALYPVDRPSRNKARGGTGRNRVISLQGICVKRCILIVTLPPAFV